MASAMMKVRNPEATYGRSVSKWHSSIRGQQKRGRAATGARRREGGVWLGSEPVRMYFQPTQMSLLVYWLTGTDAPRHLDRRWLGRGSF